MISQILFEEDLEIYVKTVTLFQPPGDKIINQTWLETCTIDIASEIDKINQDKVELKKEMDISRVCLKIQCHSTCLHLFIYTHI